MNHDTTECPLCEAVLPIVAAGSLPRHVCSYELPQREGALGV